MKTYASASKFNDADGSMLMLYFEISVCTINSSSKKRWKLKLNENIVSILFVLVAVYILAALK
jgi:hypothetical protein